MTGAPGKITVFLMAHPRLRTRYNHLKFTTMRTNLKFNSLSIASDFGRNHCRKPAGLHKNDHICRRNLRVWKVFILFGTDRTIRRDSGYITVVASPEEISWFASKWSHLWGKPPCLQMFKLFCVLPMLDHDTVQTANPYPLWAISNTTTKFVTEYLFP